MNRKRLAAGMLTLLALLPGRLVCAETGTITAEGVNLREQANTESNALRVLSLGAKRKYWPRREAGTGLCFQMKPWAISGRIIFLFKAAEAGVLMSWMIIQPCGAARMPIPMWLPSFRRARVFA